MAAGLPKASRSSRAAELRIPRRPQATKHVFLSPFDANHGSKQLHVGRELLLSRRPLHLNCPSPRCAPQATKAEWRAFIHNSHRARSPLATLIRHLPIQPMKQGISKREQSKSKIPHFQQDLSRDLGGKHAEGDQGWILVENRKRRSSKLPHPPLGRRVLPSSTMPSSIKCYHCGRLGHFASACKNELLCFYCHKSGHIKRSCPKLRAPMKIPPPSSPPQISPLWSPFKSYLDATLTSSPLVTPSLPYPSNLGPSPSPPPSPGEMANFGTDGCPELLDIDLHLSDHIIRALHSLEAACIMQVDRAVPLSTLRLMLNRYYIGPAPVLVADLLVEEGVYLVTFPSRSMADAVAERGVIYFEGFRFHFMKWTSLWGAERRLAHSKAWLRVKFIPSHLQDQHVLRCIFARFGVILNFGQAFYRGEDKENVSMLLATQNPKALPHYLRITSGLDSYIIEIIIENMTSVAADEFTSNISTVFCNRPRMFYELGTIDRPWDTLVNPYLNGEDESVDGFCDHCNLNRRYCSRGNRLPPLVVLTDSENSSISGSPRSLHLKIRPSLSTAAKFGSSQSDEIARSSQQGQSTKVQSTSEETVSMPRGSLQPLKRLRSPTPDPITPPDIDSIPDAIVEQLYGSLSKKLLPKKYAQRITVPLVQQGAHGGLSSSISHPPGFSDPRVSPSPSHLSSHHSKGERRLMSTGASPFKALDFSRLSPDNIRVSGPRSCDGFVLVPSSGHPRPGSDRNESMQVHGLQLDSTQLGNGTGSPFGGKCKGILVATAPRPPPVHSLSPGPAAQLELGPLRLPSPVEPEEDDSEMIIEFGLQLFGDLSDSDLFGIMVEYGFKIPGNLEKQRCLIRRIRELDGEDGAIVITRIFDPENF